LRHNPSLGQPSAKLSDKLQATSGGTQPVASAAISKDKATKGKLVLALYLPAG
jgi:hypothetical protein